MRVTRLESSVILYLRKAFTVFTGFHPGRDEKLLLLTQIILGGQIKN